MVSDEDKRFSIQGVVSNKGGVGVNQHVERGAVTAVVNIAEGLQNIVDVFDDTALSKQQAVVRFHEFILNVSIELCDEPQPFLEYVCIAVFRLQLLIHRWG